MQKVIIFVMLVRVSVLHAEQRSGMECISEITIPQYLNAARIAGPGTVNALVKVGAKGKASQIDIHSENHWLAEEVDYYLRRLTSYSETCEGKNLNLVFTYILDGEPAYRPRLIVRFRPPNHFLLISRPVKTEAYRAERPK
jgi:hypothetical protein